MRLTRSRVLSTVKEREQAPLLCLRAIGFDTCPRGVQINRLEDICLSSEECGREDEVLRDDGKFVEDEIVITAEISDL